MPRPCTFPSVELARNRATLATHCARLASSPRRDQPAIADALGRLVARGVHRFDHASPTVIEYPWRPHSDDYGSLDALARRVGVRERVFDERGQTWTRLRPRGVSCDLRAVIAALRARRGAALWIAGYALPCSLSADAWDAFFEALRGYSLAAGPSR